MKAAEHTELQLKWYMQSGIARVDIAVGRWPNGAERVQGWTTHEDVLIADLIDPRNSLRRWLWQRNRDHYDVYIRPAAGRLSTVVLLDDVSPETAKEIAGLAGACVIDTGAGSRHVWIRMQRALDADSRGAIQRHLADRYNADPGSTDGVHWGRLAGYRRWKPRKGISLRARLAGAPWVDIDQVSDNPALDIQCAPPQHATSVRRGVVLIRDAGAVPAGPGKARDEDTLRTASRFAKSKKSNNKPGERGKDESRVEFAFACHCIESGRSDDWIIERITQRALDRGKRRDAKQAREYARRTVKNAHRLLQNKA